MSEDLFAAPPAVVDEAYEHKLVTEYAVECTDVDREKPAPIDRWYATREEADNALWMVITSGRKRIVQRTALVGPWMAVD